MQADMRTSLSRIECIAFTKHTGPPSSGAMDRGQNLESGSSRQKRGQRLLKQQVHLAGGKACNFQEELVVSNKEIYQQLHETQTDRQTQAKFHLLSISMPLQGYTLSLSASISHSPRR